MEIIRGIWNVVVLIFVLTYFGFLTKATLSLGQSAVDLHEKGLFDLAKYNRTLVGNEDLR